VCGKGGVLGNERMVGPVREVGRDGLGDWAIGEDDDLDVSAS
jgi:hypothetical protein